MEIFLKPKKDQKTTTPNEFNDSNLISKYILNQNNLTILPILTFLEYNEVINLRMCSKQLKNVINKKLIKKYVRNGGISNLTRKEFWKANLNYSRLLLFVN